jgi:hypothetical protein
MLCQCGTKLGMKASLYMCSVSTAARLLDVTRTFPLPSRFLHYSTEAICGQVATIHYMRLKKELEEANL